MTVENIKGRLAEMRAHIEAQSGYGHGNCEAHEVEDAMYIAVLEAIAAGQINAQELAREALKSREIDFIRWCD